MVKELLHDFLAEQGAEWGAVTGEKVVNHFGNRAEECRRLVESVALIDLSARGCLAVLGVDRVKFINGQVTNEVAGLRTGQGCYAALVNAKGKMQSDLNIYRLEDELILDFEPGLLDTVTARLESHIVADQVELVDASPHFGLLSLQGPKTETTLASLGLTLPEDPHTHRKAGQPELDEWYLMRNDRIGQVGCDLYVPTPQLVDAAKGLAEAVEEQGGGLAGWLATETIRIEAGIPRFGAEMNQNTLPPEANIESRAISYSKGCYIGQEIIARIRTYGKVNRTLIGYRLDAMLAESVTPGTSLVDESNKAVATITSVTDSPKFGPIALGLAKRAHAEPGQSLSVQSQDRGQATIVSLPFG